MATERLSGYEYLILTIAIKRALNKYSQNSKSGIFVIDEAIDQIDKENFENKLSKLLEMLTVEYSKILIISQRDISKITDRVIKINRNSVGDLQLLNIEKKLMKES